MRTELESVLREGESISEVLEAAVRGAVEHRQVEAAFSARCDAAWADYQRTGISHPVEDVLTGLQARIEARRAQLQGRRRPRDDVRG